jgi:hypothetical protein
MSHINRTKQFSAEIQTQNEENKMKKEFLGLFGRIVLGMAFTMITVSACVAQDPKGGGRLAGTWEAAVTIRDCNTGAVITTFDSIANFNQGGTYLGSTSGRPQASRTPEHGVWSHIGGRTYRFKFKSFDFNAAGVAVSYGVVQHDVELNESGNAYTSAGVAKFFLMNGTQVGQGCSDAIGTRFSL